MLLASTHSTKPHVEFKCDATYTLLCHTPSLIQTLNLPCRTMELRMAPLKNKTCKKLRETNVSIPNLVLGETCPFC